MWLPHICSDENRNSNRGVRNTRTLYLQIWLIFHLMDKEIHLQRLSTEAKVFPMEVSCWATAVVMGKHKLGAYFSISSANHKMVVLQKAASTRTPKQFLCHEYLHRNCWLNKKAHRAKQGERPQLLRSLKCCNILDSNV